MGSDYIDSINKSIVLKVIEQMGEVFHTKDISEHQFMINAHPGLVKHPQYHAFVGKFLKHRLKDNKGSPLLTELESGGNRGSLWQLAEKSNTKVILGDSNKNHSNRKQVVRKGHYETLEYMESKDFQDIKELYESFEEIGGVYFRPVFKSVSAVDLHPDSPKPRIGIGEDNYIDIGMTVDEIRDSMKKRIDYLKEKRTEITTDNLENIIEAGIIREAQNNKLIMPGFPEYFRFIHSQWRIDNPENQKQSFTDIIAVDLRTYKLVIIELKANPENSAFKQVAEYVNYFVENKEEFIPFFFKLCKVMGKLYNCAELQSINSLDIANIGLVAWPDFNNNL
jgi:hypothetical protein